MYSPYVPLKPGKVKMSTEKKSCNTCTHKIGNWCERARYTCVVQRKWPSPECDEKWSGWSKKQTLLDKIKHVLSAVIKSTSKGVNKTAEKTGIKMPDNELTNNTLDD